MRKLARALARLVFGNEGLSRRLERIPWAHALARRLRLREWMNAALARYPIRRALQGSGVVYSVENFETLAVERTYFGNPLLTGILAANPPATFIDLGCNSGIFPCTIAHAAHGRAPRGLCVDANAAQVQLAQKNVALNRWPGVHVLCGLVGGVHPEKNEADFFLAPTSLGSSQFAYRETESGYPLDWKRVVVPTLRVESAWTRLFGADLRCECLKVDIEGSEMNFFRQETGLLARVDTILLEWHIWATTRDEIVRFLDGRNFRLEQTIENEPRHGVLFFRNRRRTKESGE
ncbi:MAG TPA: FkbM family methyltransferase [Candidatus Methylacidiphilales bacterium]|nr:FkbM family methyltransferase [Candidatus Methylacidiphilales bacterium]